MPRHALQRFRIKWSRRSCLSPSFSFFFSSSFCIFSGLFSDAQTDRNVCPTTFHIHSHAPQIHLVCVHDLTNSPRRVPHRSREPQEIISNPDDPLVSQHRKKSLLHRRQWHQRPIQIKKRGDPSVLLWYVACFLWLLMRHYI